MIFWDSELRLIVPCEIAPTVATAERKSADGSHLDKCPGPAPELPGWGRQEALEDSRALPSCPLPLLTQVPACHGLWVAGHRAKPPSQDLGLPQFCPVPGGVTMPSLLPCLGIRLLDSSELLVGKERLGGDREDACQL